MKIEEKNKAVELRKAGLTYNEILAKLPVSKSSLNYWLHDITLTDQQKSRIYAKDLEVRRKFVEHNELRHKKSVSNKAAISAVAQREIVNLSQRDLKLIGTALYWAEGYKTGRAKQVDFANSDPAMIRLIMRWFREICRVSDDRFRARIQVHDARIVQEAIKFWSLTTGIPIKQFTKSYIRVSPTSRKKVKNYLPHGICHIRISYTNLLAKIKGWISGLSEAL
jgi:hypothetical protein